MISQKLATLITDLLALESFNLQNFYYNSQKGFTSQNSDVKWLQFLKKIVVALISW